MAKSNQTRKLPRYASTSEGLHHWYKCMFEKMGWMVLAKAKGYDYKIDNYKKSIANLIKSIKHVMAEYENKNRKHDLKVLLMNTEVLQAYVQKHM